jgi:hypothetical protein
MIDRDMKNLEATHSVCKKISILLSSLFGWPLLLHLRMVLGQCNNYLYVM